MTVKFSDIQLVLLTTAAQRPDGNLLPPPDSLGEQSARITKAIPPLLKRKMIEEVQVSGQSRRWRHDGHVSFGVVITQTGRAALGIEPPAHEPSPPARMPAVDEQPVAKPPTKASLVLHLMQRSGGATLTELVEATGWLPHTTRAALTGLRKKGHAIAKGKRDDTTCYTIAAAA